MVRCRSVCKRWFDLIFNHYFIQRFEFHNFSHSSFALVIRPFFHNSFKDHILLKPQHNIQIPETDLDGSRFTLSSCFLPEIFNHIPDKDLQNVKVIGVANDLILCYNRLPNFDHIFYICNLQTKDWVQLPKRLFNPCNDFQAALIYQPYNYSRNNYKSHYRCRVVVVFRDERQQTQLDGYIFSFETGKWDQVVLQSPKSYAVYSVWGDSLDYNDTICFYNRRGNVMIVFDPFTAYTEDANTDAKVVSPCQFVHWPEHQPQRFLERFAVKIGICEGILKLCCFRKQVATLSVWKLNDYYTSDWSLQYKVALTDVVFGPLDDTYVMEDVVGLHPFYENIVYVQTRSHVMMWNLTTRRVEKVSIIPKEFKLIGGFSHVLWLFLPLQPTPLIRSQN